MCFSIQSGVCPAGVQARALQPSPSTIPAHKNEVSKTVPDGGEEEETIYIYIRSSMEEEEEEEEEG